jgi:hypothetical protein
MAPERSLSYSQKPTTEHYLESADSNPHTYTLPLTPILIISDHLRLGISCGLLSLACRVVLLFLAWFTFRP